MTLQATLPHFSIEGKLKQRRKMFKSVKAYSEALETLKADFRMTQIPWWNGAGELTILDEWEWKASCWTSLTTGKFTDGEIRYAANEELI